MVDIFVLSVAQLALAFVIVCVLGIVVLLLTSLLRAALGLNKQPVEYIWEFDAATIPRKASWQYTHDFFEKIEEFRSDFD